MNVDLVVNADDVARRGVAQYVREIRARGRDMRPAWDDVLDVIHRREKMLFENEGADTEHGPWPPLSNNPIRFHRIAGLMVGYATWKAHFYPGRKILELTGKLKRQVTGEDDTGYLRRGVRRLTFGTEYANYDRVPGRPRSSRDRLTGDLGGITAEGRPDYFPMEPREIFRVDAPYVDEIADRALDYLLDAPEGSGGTVGSGGGATATSNGARSGVSSWGDARGHWGARQHAGSVSRGRAMRAWAARNG